MEEREIGTGASCFLVKDESIKRNWHNSPIYAWLKREGFIGWKKGKSIEGIDWVYINIYSKVFTKGIGGVAITKVVGNHAITFQEFLTIYNIYKKNEGFSTLKMTPQEQAEFEAYCAKIEAQKTQDSSKEGAN